MELFQLAKVDKTTIRGGETPLPYGRHTSPWLIGRRGSHAKKVRVETRRKKAIGEIKYSTKRACHIFGPRGVGASQSVLLTGTYSSKAKFHAATSKKCVVIACASAGTAKEGGHPPTVPGLREPMQTERPKTFHVSRVIVKLMLRGTAQRLTIPTREN